MSTDALFKIGAHHSKTPSPSTIPLFRSRDGDFFGSLSLRPADTARNPHLVPKSVVVTLQSSKSQSCKVKSISCSESGFFSSLALRPAPAVGKMYRGNGSIVSGGIQKNSAVSIKHAAKERLRFAEIVRITKSCRITGNAEMDETTAVFEPSRLTPIQDALMSIGGLSSGNMKLLADTLLEMEENFESYDDGGNNLNDISDAFCGCTREELHCWHVAFDPFIRSLPDTPLDLKGRQLLLRALLNSQRNYFLKRKDMADKGYYQASAEVDHEKSMAMQTFYCRAEVYFEVALRWHFPREWAPAIEKWPERNIFWNECDYSI